MISSYVGCPRVFVPSLCVCSEIWTLPELSNLVPRAHVPFGADQKARGLWERDRALSQRLRDWFVGDGSGTYI